MQLRTATHHAATLAFLLGTLGALTYCGGVVRDDDPEAAAGSAGGRRDVLSCDVVQGRMALTALTDNPSSCEPSMICSVWFGHGQHLSCPERVSAAPGYLDCDIWDCICTVHGEPGVEADFSTGEVVDARDPSRVCRYRLEALDTEG